MRHMALFWHLLVLIVHTSHKYQPAARRLLVMIQPASLTNAKV